MSKPKNHHLTKCPECGAFVRLLPIPDAHFCASSPPPPSEYEMSNRLDDTTERLFEDFGIAVSNVRVARSERDVAAAWDIVDEKQSALRVHIREREALLRKENGLLVEIAQDNHDSLEMLRLRVDSATPSSPDLK